MQVGRDGTGTHFSGRILLTPNFAPSERPGFCRWQHGLFQRHVVYAYVLKFLCRTHLVLPLCNYFAVHCIRYYFGLLAH